MAEQSPRVRVEPNPKWIRGVHNGRTVVDSTTARLVWEIPYYPAWYFPIDDVHAELKPNGGTFRSPSRGTGTRFDLVLGADDGAEDLVIVDAAWRHLDSPVRCSPIRAVRVCCSRRGSRPGTTFRSPTFAWSC